MPLNKETKPTHRPLNRTGQNVFLIKLWKARHVFATSRSFFIALRKYAAYTNTK